MARIALTTIKEDDRGQSQETASHPDPGNHWRNVQRTSNVYAYADEDAFDLPPIRAIFPPMDDTYGSGGTGYYGATSSFDDSAYWEQYENLDLPTCEEVLDGIPEGCDVTNPPSLLPNGCGGGPTAGVIPDSLVFVYDGNLSQAFPGIFTESCNTHDLCYATVPGNKTECDDGLVQNMIAAAKDGIPATFWQAHGSAIMNQINAYGAFFDSAVGSPISMVFFDAAQDDAVCVNYSHAVQLYCRSYQ